ncbi:PAS domain S-box-containing protein [Polaromonas sp. CG_9.5]|uniref:CHASE3 domain-containing protein n=1 Tax=Polaromonas sp. CG_9.5 TaxID=3071705 RepID=UPI002E06BD50|nr:PAS domain S-box-containing protein [Polaromonas sp. CG_9.5]
MKWSVGTKIGAGFVLALVVLVVIGLTSYRSLSNLIEASRLKTHTYIVLGDLEGVLSQLKDAETGQRGYIITGQESYLEPYHAAAKMVGQLSDELRKLTADNPNQQRRLDVLQSLVASKLDELKLTIDLRKSKGFEAALAVVVSGQGKQAMDNARKVIAEMVDEEKNLLQVRDQRVSVDAERAISTIVYGIPLAFVLLTVAGFLLTRNISNPLKRLESFARDVSEKGFGTGHTEVADSLEVASLAQSINRMLDHLKQQHDKLMRSEVQAQEVSASLRDSERRMKAVLDNMDDGIITISDSGIIELINPAAERIFGYRREDVVGKNVSMLMPEPYHSEHDGYLTRYLRTGQAKIIGSGSGRGRELTGQRSDGGVFPMDLHVSEFYLEGRRQFIGSIRDITERKRIAEALRASELQLRQITDAVPALIADLDMEQRFRFHNKAYEDVFGLSFEQINGRTLAEVLGPQAYGGAQDKVEEVLRGYPVRYERVQITPQGDIRNYAMQYFPRYGGGTDEGKVIGFFSLGTDVTELKRIDRMKTEFVSTVSHELRTPLTSIRGSLGLIAGGVAGELPEAVKKLVGIAKNNCERLIRLINDILDIEKIESGKIRLDLQVVDIKQLVQQALAANEGFAGQHRVTLLLRAPDEPLQVRIDSDRLTQVLTNLLSNAVKFSPPESAVEVRVSRVAQQVRVEVADHGPGIPEEFRSRIFQKFSQADASDARQKGGTGLGLNISKALIEKMGGHIGFSSEAGAGTTFFFEVPEWQNPAPLPPPSRARAASSRPRILICESDPDVARLISMMLGKAGFEADLALSAAQALACLARNSYDAVTVDLKLPGQHGAAFISALRRDARTRELPVVVISAMAEEGQLQFDHKLLTVSDWLEKPIDENRLILSIRRAVAGVGAGKPRVLHVEDDPDIQLIVGAIVQDSAIFEFAATLNEARALLREHRFDLVLLDLALGEESGWDLFDDIDALDPRPPVIVFSASDVDSAEGKQVEAVLVKAYTSNTELLNTIQRALQIPGDPGPTRPQPLS